MNYCEKVDIEKLKGFIEKETGLQVEYIKLRNGGLYVNVFSSEKNINKRYSFEDFTVIPLDEEFDKKSNQLLNGFKLIWNKFLAETFGEEYKKAYHNYYFKNVDIDILKKDDEQER
ncbi:MAG: hypothetical protein J5779_02725 [Clostridia bacterium]|nr:hypothetical protein [Clostridia bacterium]